MEFVAVGQETGYGDVLCNDVQVSDRFADLWSFVTGPPARPATESALFIVNYFAWLFIELRLLVVFVAIP